MTARFWLPIVFGLGKVALVLLCILVVLVAVADAREQKQAVDVDVGSCDEIAVLRVPPLPSCRSVPQSAYNPRWVVVLMSSYIPYMALDVPVPKAYGPERLRRFGPYDNMLECIEAIERWNNPMVVGYYVECWALDKWSSYHALWREKTIASSENTISDLRRQISSAESSAHRQLLLRRIREAESRLQDELRER